MNWAALASALATCFVLEIGDKTQLAAISMAISSKSPFSVFIGAALGLALITAVGVFFGEVITRYIPEHYLRRVSAVLFVAVGIWMWFGE